MILVEIQQEKVNKKKKRICNNSAYFNAFHSF